MEYNSVENMSFMFYNCQNLEKIPGISKWDTSEVKYMKGMFYQCSSLKGLPEISNWNIQNLIDISYMFYNCKGLTLSDIKKWNISNIKEKTNVCEVLFHKNRYYTLTVYSKK